MSKSKTLSNAFKSLLGPLVAPGSPPAAPRFAIPGPTTPIKPPTYSGPTHDLVLNNLAAACRITKDAAEALNKIPYIKAVTGVVAQILNIYEEVQGNKERCKEVISLITKYAYTVIECLADLYTAEGEYRLESLKAELKSFQSYLETILLLDLESLRTQSQVKAYAKRDQDAEDMRRMERELKGFVDRFTIKAVTAGIRATEALKPMLTEMQQAALQDHWLRSQHAQYNIAIVDASSGSVDRAICAPATREPVLERITTWACSQSLDSPAIFWVVGEGGAGKSTIARTIAKKFDEDIALPSVVTFFCSRKFTDTNQQVYIIPTIAYQLARLCPFYSSELLKDVSIVDSLRVVAKQMDSLLVKPWNASSDGRSLDNPPFLIVIDALDEIVSQEDGDDISGGFAFLKSLFKAVEQGYLKGIKFLVTSRPHPELSEVCRSLPSDAICRLYDVPTNEIEQDICRYLHHRLPKLQTPADYTLLQSIATKADGLFIFASTAVLMANPTPGTTIREQRRALKGLLDGIPSYHMGTSPINSLYCQVLADAFEHRNGPALSDRMNLLHTIICTEDRVSVDVLVSLISREDDDDDEDSIRELVEDLLHRLHAVLWISDGCITWYHASFLDFLFSSASASITCSRGKLDASCNPGVQHETLARKCFHIMRSCLKFNICHLPSSFLLDSEVEDLATRVENRIPQLLRYVCRYWAIHTSKSIGHGVQEDIAQFLDENLLFWIEAMNLVQQSSLCATLLNMVQQHTLHQFPNASDLYKDLSAASHFSTVFKGSHASKSTPHLYMSTLVYTAPRFPLLKKWRARFTRLPEIHTRGIGTQLLMTLHGHTGQVHSAAFSPTGKRIVSGSNDRSIRVWDLETGEEIMKLEGKGHTGYVNSVVFFSDGTRIVFGSADGYVRVWNVETGAEIQKFLGCISSVYSVALSSDESRIVAGSDRHYMRVTDIETGQVIKELSGHTRRVNSVTFSPDDKRIVSGSHDRSVRVWDVDKGEGIMKLDGHTSCVFSVAFSFDGTRIVSGSDDRSVRVWDAETGEGIMNFCGHTISVLSVAFSHDGAHILSGSADNSVRIWDVGTGQEIKKLNGHTDSVRSVAFSPDGSSIVSGSDDFSVRVWDVEMSEEIKRIDGPAARVLSVAFSPDDDWIVFGSEDGSVRVWDVVVGEEIMKLDGHKSSVNSVVFFSDGARIVSGSDDRSVRVWNVETGEEIMQLNGHTGCVYSVALSPDGACIASGSRDCLVLVWNAELGEEMKKLDGHRHSVYSIAFSPDGHHIVTGSHDSSVRVWDVEMGQQIMEITGHTRRVHSVAFSPDGTRIVSASDDNLWVRDVKTGEEIMQLDGHIGSVISAAFSLDGTCIVSSSQDRSVRVWDAATGGEMMKLNGHANPVSSVAFSSDGNLIVSGSYDNSVRVWDVRSASELLKLSESIHNVNSKALADGNNLNSDLALPTPPLPQLKWTVDDDGWIVQLPTMNRIMWLPDIFIAYLYRPANSLIISPKTATLDLAGVEFGSNWTLCYKP